ncbi:MAG: AraC family transcriptional regulator [Verrucomicrobia bacterium]|nr:MAG: AraC family transcriptional regulator [Verrucomicrobiota bacterium]
MKTVAPIPSNPPSIGNTVIGALLGSKIFRDYRRAFKDLTGMGIKLRPTDSWPLPGGASSESNPLCRLPGRKKCSCVCCRRTEKRIAMHLPIRGPIVAGEPCHCGAAIPLALGRHLVGILQMVGRVRDQVPAAASRKKDASRGVPRASAKDEGWAAQPPSLTDKQYAAAVKLLGIFAKHLAIVSNHAVVQARSTEPPLITRARAYIEANCATDLSLGQTARALNLSTFYFCKLFKKATGIKFSEYLSRVRLERAKKSLLDPNVRVSELAFEAGFQSLTHFNPVFKNLVGVSPREFRKQAATG